MENRNITTKIIVCSYDELNEEEKKLIDAAKEATNRSYSPYSRFQVGAAALLSGGTVITGSNQENAAYPSGICAERTTLFYANSQYPDLPVEALAIAAQTSGDFIDHPTPFTIFAKELRKSIWTIISFRHENTDHRRSVRS